MTMMSISLGMLGGGGRPAVTGVVKVEREAGPRLTVTAHRRSGARGDSMRLMHLKHLMHWMHVMHLLCAQAQEETGRI